MSFNNIEINYKGKWAVVYINRPEAMNALNIEVLQELRTGVNLLVDNDDIKVIVITGKGKAFVAGADIAQMKSMNCLEAKKFARLGNDTFNTIDNCYKPVIAAVNGFALGGGCELALACDIRIGSENAVLGQPEINLGIIPGFGGTQRLPKIVGAAKAKELIYTGKKVTAGEAIDLDLLNKVVSQEKLMDTVEEMAKKIASKSPVILNIAKEAINNGLEKDVCEGIKLESNYFSLCFSTEDQREGIAAFLEKRNPEFKGK